MKKHPTDGHRRSVIVSHARHFTQGAFDLTSDAIADMLYDVMSEPLRRDPVGSGDSRPDAEARRRERRESLKRLRRRVRDECDALTERLVAMTKSDPELAAAWFPIEILEGRRICSASDFRDFLHLSEREFEELAGAPELTAFPPSFDVETGGGARAKRWYVDDVVAYRLFAACQAWIPPEDVWKGSWIDGPY